MTGNTAGCSCAPLCRLPLPLPPAPCTLHTGPTRCPAAAVADPCLCHQVGASLAIAIGVHNIPEGIVVAIPILHATGSKWKAFFWGAVSGLAETVAGAIGWIVLSSTDGDISSLGYALLFGLVAGMMVYICLKELIPTAHKYDKHDKYATNCCILGMLVMAASLSLFVG